MVKTVVLIGNFFGELNCLKESIGRINQEIRFLSFLDPSSALSMLENNSIPVADFILTDELVASQHLNLMKKAAHSAAHQLILFMHDSGSQSHSQGLLTFHKCRNKKEYAKFLSPVLSKAK